MYCAFGDLAYNLQYLQCIQLYCISHIPGEDITDDKKICSNQIKPCRQAILVWNSNFQFRFLGPPSEAEFWFCFQFWIFRPHFFFRILLLKSHQIGILVLKFRIPIFLSRKTLHLIFYCKIIVLAQLVKHTTLDHVDVGTIPTLGELLINLVYRSVPSETTSTCYTCKMSRCDLGGQSNHATKLTFTQNE